MRNTARRVAVKALIRMKSESATQVLIGLGIEADTSVKSAAQPLISSGSEVGTGKITDVLEKIKAVLPSYSEDRVYKAWKGEDINQTITITSSERKGVKLTRNIFQRAAEEGHTEVVKAILELDVQLEKPYPPQVKTPIYFAAEKGHTEIVKLLVEDGRFPHRLRYSKNDYYSILDIAAVNGHLDTVNYLLKLRTDGDRFEGEEIAGALEKVQAKEAESHTSSEVFVALESRMFEITGKAVERSEIPASSPAATNSSRVGSKRLRGM